MSDGYVGAQERNCAPYYYKAGCALSRLIYNIHMPEYRRVKQNGGIYFFTLVTYRRQELFVSPEIRNLFMQTVNEDYATSFL